MKDTYNQYVYSPEPSWELIKKEAELETHVMPINDIRKHKDDCACFCIPDCESRNGWKQYVHHSVDKREYFETDSKKRMDKTN